MSLTLTKNKKRMKIIFLDFDGVLTTPQSNYQFNPSLFERLRVLLEKSGAYIVITSSWRGMTKEETIISITDRTNPSVGGNPFPFVDKIIGVTPRIGWTRGQQITGWFKRHEKLDEIQQADYVIIDDENDFSERQREHLVRTNENVGITDEDVKKALQILNC